MIARRKVALSDLVEFENSKRSPLSTAERAKRPGPYPYHGAAGILDYIDDYKFDGLFVLVGEDGTVIDERGAPVLQLVRGKFWVSNHAHVIRMTNDVDTLWLYYALRNSQIGPFLSGSVQPKLSLGNLKRLEISVPYARERREIAKRLGALDDKIESNLSSIQIQHELLSLEFQRILSGSDKVYVPLNDIAQLAKGVSYKSVDLMPSATALVTLKSIDRNGGYKADGLKPYVGPYKPTQLVKPGEIVVAQTDLTQGAEVVGRAVRVPGSPHVGTLVASLDLVIARPKGNISSEYLLGVLTHEPFRQHCRNRTNGTTVLHLASDAIPTYLAPMVHPDAQESFAQYSSSVHALIDSLTLENSTLFALRDSLLPEMLSGRVHVGDAAR